MLLAIDPGRDTGWAAFDTERKLVQCDLGDPREVKHYSTRVVIERPQVYDRTHSKGDPNDLITLAINVGEYKGYFESHGADVDLVLPAQWKGQVPKDIHNARVWALLTELERACVPNMLSAKKHNVLDAIGIGLWWLRRLRGPTVSKAADQPGR